MGNAVTRSPPRKKNQIREKNSKTEFYNKLKSSQVGQELLVCSFGSWCREQRQMCGFSDNADYTSSRRSLLQTEGSSNKPDTTEGRFFRSSFKGKREMSIQEKETANCISVKLPRVTSTEMSTYLRNNRPRRRRKKHRCPRVVAYHDGYVIIQVNTEKFIPFTKFYIIDVGTQVCCGHFVVANNVRRWYEVYVSPSSTQIVLRADAGPHFQTALNFVNFEIQNVTSYPPMSQFRVWKMPQFLPRDRVTYNAQLGDDHVITVNHMYIQIFKTEDWSVCSAHNLMLLNARIQQIRSSPSGTFLAVRYAFPGDGCHHYHILILQYPSFIKTIQVDMRGAYWPLSELINLHVFPRFSLSEACLAVMKQHNFGRKVFVYKLPVELLSLRDLCRKTISHLVNSTDVPQLPIPGVVQNYLTPRNL